MNIFSNLLFAAVFDISSHGRIDRKRPVKLDYGRRIRKNILLNA